MLGSLYVIMSLGCNDNKKICKIGSTKNVKNRMMVYKTCFPDTDNITCHIIELKQSKYDCYQLDESIKKLSAKYAIPYPHYNGTGGEEFYLLDDMSADAVLQVEKNSFAGFSEKPLCDSEQKLDNLYKVFPLCSEQNTSGDGFFYSSLGKIKDIFNLMDGEMWVED